MHIPVFCYHNAIAEGLEVDLAFLADNGYQTLLAGELVDVLTGATPAPGKPVALTFDDGLLSLLTVGLPLQAAWRTDLLEERTEPLPPDNEAQLSVRLRPHEIVTLEVEFVRRV